MFKRYLKDTGGNVAMMFTASLMAMVVGIGAAVDFSAMSKERSAYQNIADAAALAAARSGETDTTNILAIAEKSVEAHDTLGLGLTTTVHLTNDDRVQVTVSGVYTKSFMGMFGNPTSDLTAMAEATLPSGQPVNIALVLDTTSSMGYDGKLTTLKSASTSLIDNLASFNSEHIQISVVPFSQYVNIGLAQRNEIWMDVDADWTETFAETCNSVEPVLGTDPNNCGWEPYPARDPSAAEPQHMCNNDGIEYLCGGRAADPGYPAGQNWVCANITGPEEEQCSTRTPVEHKWNGCVGSRQGAWNEEVHYQVGKKIPGLMDQYCGKELLPLTDNMDDVKAKIDSLSAYYNTYIPAGLMWGWRTLNTQMPLTEASGPNAAKTKSVMILMTDGANTLSKTAVNDDRHTGTDVIEANNLTEKLCDNIKNDNITIYSIAYDITDVTTKNLIRNCATNPSMYYDARDNAALEQAFSDIGSELIKLRLTH